ncbi:hypothetical protein KUTeg_011097 [Tegillarca granosa]|uniref:Uncharacterized protein n=1 Tax=Tegillarca granosa TaxID=220873 RepID=A0ABQ9F797_TEGGR|nr:hypothetical protein KUTeg_011097 [Tegillarca granosa]
MDITRPLLSSIVQRRRNLNISRDTNFSSTMPNVTTSTIGSNFSSYVNLTDIGQINILNTNSGITIQDQVIIGAGAVVGILAIVAVVLRILMPMFRKTKKKREKPTYDQYDGDKKSSCGSCNDLEIEEDKVSRRLNDTLLKSTKTKV